MIRLGLIVALVIGLTVQATPASASPDVDRQQELKRTMSQLREDMGETSQQLAAAAKRLREWEQQLDQAQKAVQAALARLEQARQRDAAIAARYRVVREREVATEAQVVALQAQMDATQDQINALASASYQQGRLSEVAVYLQAKTPEEMAARMAYTESATNSEDALLQRLSDQKAVVDAQQRQLEADRIELADLRAQAQQVVADKLASAEQAKQGRAKVAALTAKARAAKQELDQELAAEQDKYDQMRAESAQIRQRLAARAAAVRSGSSGYVPVVSSSGFVMPTYGPITSPYGWRTSPISGRSELHDGTDFAPGCGAPVYAIASGTVIEHRYSSSWGNRVVLELGTMNGNLLSAGYNHLSGFAVGYGQYVAKGQVVGYVGSTGWSTGCHLHLNLYVNGTPVNPMGYL